MRTPILFSLVLAASLLLATPAVHAQTPAASSSSAPAASTKKAPVDSGKTMKKVLAQMTGLTADENAKIQKIMADATLKGAKRRDAVVAALTPDHQTQFKTLWKAAHAKSKSKKGAAPAASSSAAPAK